MKESVNRLKASVSRFLGANVIEKPAIVRGLSLGYVEMGVGLVLSFALTPLILRHLGATAYGLWATLGSVAGYFVLTDFGMTAAIAKYTAEYRARGEIETLNRLLSTMIGAFIIIGGVIVLLAFMLAPFIQKFFYLPGDLASTGQAAFLIMIINVAMSLVSGSLSYVIYGHQRVDIQKTIAILQTLINAALVVLLLNLGMGLIGVVIASSVSVIGAILFSLIYIYRSQYGLSFRPQLFDPKMLREVAPYSLRCFILGMTAQVLYRTDNIVIAAILGTVMVTPYAIVYKLCFVGAMISFKISDTLQPTFTRLYTIGDHAGLRTLYLKTMRLSVGVMVPIAVFLLVFGRSFIDLWVGAENFAGMGGIAVLVVMNLVHSLNPSFAVLQAIGKNQAVMYSAVLDALLNLLLSILLAHKIGLMGVALGTLLAHLCTDTWVVIWSSCKNTNLPVRTLLSASILPPLLAGVPVAVISFFLLRDLFPNTLLFLGMKGILLAATYVCTCLIIWFILQKMKALKHVASAV